MSRASLGPVPSRPSTSPHWSWPLRGHWTNERARGKSVVEIEGVHARSRSGSLAALARVGDKKFTIEKAGKVCSGQLDEFGRLTWEDGSTWIRHPITEGRVQKCVVCYGTGSRNPYALRGERVKCPHCFGSGRRSACHWEAR
mmetsp:Transcript_35542/g.101060  ORF Transcript_35542/g.101060 Transcript_35542/m.101060 type:complete len:142 (-) Transcript_35542:123-548(-)